MILKINLNLLFVLWKVQERKSDVPSAGLIRKIKREPKDKNESADINQQYIEEKPLVVIDNEEEEGEVLSDFDEDKCQFCDKTFTTGKENTAHVLMEHFVPVDKLWDNLINTGIICLFKWLFMC